MSYKCLKCKIDLEPSSAYEYRGAISCADHFDEVVEFRNFERQEIMAEERTKTDKFRGLDLSDSAIGRGNRELLKGAIEVASKESGRLKRYEERQ
jgi:hypothetical protein